MILATAIVGIIFGLIELFLGRKLFWLFVAIGGFLLGWFLVPAIWPNVDTWVSILVGVVAGLLFALLAVLSRRIMVAIGGFFLFAGAGVLLVRFLGAEAAAGSTAYWVAYLVGGLIGAVLLFLLFDWALIVLTSIAGAGAVASGIAYLSDGMSGWLEVVIFVVLAGIGIAFQTWTFRRRPHVRRSRWLA